MPNALRLVFTLLALLSLISAVRAQQPPFLTNGLVAYFPFNGNANDESGNGNNGIPLNGCRIENGTAIFDDVPAKILVSNPKNLPQGTSARTASFWFRQTMVADIDPRSGIWEGLVLSWGNCGYLSGIYGAVDKGHALSVWHHMNDAGFGTGLRGEATTNQWHHGCITKIENTSSFNFYLDGVLVFTRSTPTVPSVDYNRLEIAGSTHPTTPSDGSGIGQWGDSYTGTLDNIRIYSRALSNAEVSSLYAYESNRLVPTVVTAPADQSLVAGQILTLSAQIMGSNLSYRWQKDGVDLQDGGRISGATTPELSISGLIPADSGQYRLTASNANGSASTAAATVNVTSVGDRWRYQRRISLSNVGNASAVSDVQFRLVLDTATPIGEGKMNASGNDIRFLDGNRHELPHWLQSGMNTGSTVLWVRVDQISANSVKDIFLVYGNGSAQNVSSGARTFPFFDDFSGTLSRWMVRGGASASVSGGKLLLSVDSPDVYTTLTSFETFPPGFAAHFTEKRLNGSRYHFSKGFGSNTDRTRLNGGYWPPDSLGMNYGHDGSVAGFGASSSDEEVPLAVPYSPALKEVEFHSQDGRGSLFVNRSFVVSTTNNVPSTSLSVFLWLNGWDGVATTWEIDDVFVRKLPPVSFTVEIGPETVTGLTAIAHPQSTTLIEGQSLQLSAAFSGLGPISYRWKKDDADVADGGRISGAATPLLTIAGVIPADAGQYRLTATNSTGSAVTASATLTVHEPARITVQPQSVDGMKGDTVVLSVGASGFPAPTFQWTKDGNPLPGATNATLTLTNAQPVHIGDYQVVLANAAGSVTSSVAALNLHGVKPGIWKGLVAYFPFSGNANDESGNGNHLTPRGSPVFSASDRFGRAGSAVTLDGEGDYLFLDKPIAESALVHQPLTISFWRKGIGADTAVAVENDSTVLWAVGGRANSSLGGDMNVGVSGGRSSFGTGKAFDGAVWMLTVYVLDGVNSRIYTNGVVLLNGNFPQSGVPPIDSRLYVGADPYAGFEYWNGQFDDIRIYNRALTEAEVAALYASEMPQPVGITVQPQGVTVNSGQTVSFTVGATNATTFQWTKDGNPLAGATNSTLTLTNVQPVHIGDYRVVVANGSGSVTSEPAVFALNGVNTGIWKGLVAWYPFDEELMDQTGRRTDPASFYGVTLGVDRFGRPGRAINFGPDRMTYVDLGSGLGSVSPVELTQSIWIKAQGPMPPGKHVVVFSRFTRGTGGWITLEFNPRGQLSAEVTNPFYGNATLVETDPAEVLDGRWHQVAVTWGAHRIDLYVDGKLRSSGVDAASIASDPDGSPFWIGRNYWADYAPLETTYFRGALDDFRLYERALSDVEVASLYASEAPPPAGITTQPQAMTVNVGANVTFTVGATNGLTYQWTKDGVVLPGATNPTLTVTGVQPVHIGDYRVVVANGAGSVTSEPAALTLNGVDGRLWSGLVGWYRFDGNATDSGTFGQHGTEHAVGYHADRFGRSSSALRLSETAQPNSVVVTNAMFRAGQEDFTVAIWVALPDLAEADGIGTVFNTVPHTGLGMGFGTPGQAGELRFSVGTGQAWSSVEQFPGVTGWETGRWKQVVLVKRGADVRQFANGLLVTEATVDSQFAVDCGLLFGSSSHGGSTGSAGYNFNGLLDEARIYNRALSDAEVTAIYAYENTPPVPTVMAVPTNETRLVGEGVTLSAQIAGFAPMSYRWQKNGADLSNGGQVSGADSQTLTLTGLTLGDAGQYRLTATNSTGSAVTASATLTVHEPARITVQPQSVDGVEGDTVALSVGASGFPAPTFQWFKNGTAIPGATGATLQFAGLVETNAGSYRVVVSNVAGSETSAAAVVGYTPAIRVLVNGTPVSGTVRTLDPVTVELQFAKPDWFLFYTLDGSEPDFTRTPYVSPFVLNQPGELRMVAYSGDFVTAIAGRPVTFRFLTPQSISWGTLPSLRFGDSGPLAVSASSGLSVGVSVVSGPATLAGGVLTATGAGTVTLRAVQAGNDQFAPVSEERTLVIGPAVQTLTWPILAAKAFGDPAFGVTVTVSSGLPVVLSVASGKATVSGTNVTLNGAGAVTLRAEQAGNPNYAAVTEERSFTVAKAPQTLTFPTIANRTYALEPFTPVVVTSSGLPAVLELLSGPATANGNQLTLTGVGTVIVRATQPGNEDWEAALPSDRTFTVTPGTQRLSFEAVPPKTFGDGPVTLVATSSAGLPVSFRVLSGPGGLAGEVLTLNGAGNIVLQALQAGTANYLAASASQTVVVSRAAQSVNFAALPDQRYTTNAIPLVATATSGLPVSFRLVSGAATVTGAELRLTGIGGVSVAANQAGDGNWLPATTVTNGFSVSRGVQTIDFATIGDQILGNPPVTLSASASSGLPVTFQVLSGPATVTGNQLTLLSEGSVTVRARQVGSPLWLAAQADQTFAIRKLTTLTLTPVTGGSLTMQPVKERYGPAESVTVTAVPAAGFEFGGWTGDLAGFVNPATLLMSANRTVGANFTDVAAPVLTWDLPVAGTTGNEQAVLAGRVSDNAPGANASWNRDGGAAQALTLGTDGSFRVEGLTLGVGTNTFAVIVRDAAGNQTTAERSVVWVPERVLRVVDVAEVQDGQRLVFPVELQCDAANVAGMSFKLRYDPAHLADPQVEWGALVGRSVNNLNLGIAGEIGGSFALAGAALPAGTNRVATVSFRARSVPVRLAAELRPAIQSLSSPSGAALPTGNAAVAGSGFIKPRRLKGDSNANQRLDIGDAVVISRLEVGLEERRTWDVGLNDLNISGSIDSGDVVKALRAVVGLDPQPTPSGGVARSGLARQQSPLPLANTNDVVTLEFPDGPVAALGQPWRVVVRLVKSKQPPSGLSFTLRYPTGLTLGEKQVGALIPAGALPLWGEVPGGLTLAAVSPDTWPASTGVAAVMTFTANAGLAVQAEWPVTLAPVELTVNGFDIRALDDVAGVVRSASVPAESPVIALPPPGADGKLVLEVSAGAGQEVIVETTTDLNVWTESQRITGQGTGTPVRVTITPQVGVEARFWRVRRP